MKDPAEYLRHVMTRREERSGNSARPNRLSRALSHGGGYVAVIGRKLKWAEAMLEVSLPLVDPGAAVRVKAGEGPTRALDRVLRALPRGISGQSDPQSKLEDLVTRARAAGKLILVIVQDADTASVEELERVRVALDVGNGTGIDTLKLVLLGTPALQRKLADPAASALQSRITSCVRASRKSGRVPEPITRAVRVRRSMIRIAAAVATFAVLSNVPQFRDALHLGDEPWMVDLKATAVGLEAKLRAALASAGARLADERERLADPGHRRETEPSR